MKAGEVMDDVHENEIKERDVTAQKQHGDEDDNRGIGQLLVTTEAPLLWVPRPRSFLELDLYFAEKTFGLAEHIFSRLATRQEGLEPPTDGFGDRNSTN